MSMDAVRVSAQAHKKALDNQNKRQELELAMSKDNHSAQLGEVRKAYRNDVQNLKDEHTKEVAEQTFDKEKKLEQMRIQLQQSQNLTDNELKRQQELLTAQKAEKVENFRKDMDTIREQQEVAMDDNNHRYHQAMRDAHLEYARESQAAEDRFAQQDAAQKQHWDIRLNKNREMFSNRYKSEEDRFNISKNQQEHLHKKHFRDTHQKHEVKMADMNKRHTQEEEMIKQRGNQAIQAKEVFFEKKYQDQLKRHNELDQTQQKRYVDLQEKSKEDLHQRVALATQKAGDPFFDFTEMRPELTEQPDHYVLKVPTPEYAKEETIVSSNTKEIVLHTNRRHKDVRKNEDGSTSKVDKAESLVTRIPVNSVLNPRKMTKEWADGVTTFKIWKA